MNKLIKTQPQKGIATLTVTIVIVIILTLMVFFATKVGLLDQRMAGNEVRYKEAFAQAEAGLDFATQRFSSEFTRLYDGTNPTTASTSLLTILANSQAAIGTETDGTSPESGEGFFTVTVTPTTACFPVPVPPSTCTSTSPPPPTTTIPIYNFVSIGTGADGTGNASVQRQITMSHALGGNAPNTPVIAGGAVGTGGNFNVVGNPNAGGPGVPVSIWTGPPGSGADITASSSSATCHIQFYDGTNAQCSNPSGKVENITRGTNPATAQSAYDPTKRDLLPNDPNFPPDLFAFVFGLPRTDWLTKRNEAEDHGQSVTDCSQIKALGTAAGVNFTLWWVAGNCEINGDTIGTTAKPVVLVIDDGVLEVKGDSRINGVVYIFNNESTGGTASADFSGTSEIRGSLISEVGFTANSSYSVVWEPTVINSFTNGGGSNFTIAYIPGSWRDFQ